MKKLFFFGNYFYGLCVVALSIEAALQQQVHLAPVIYYLLIFSATVVFYTRAYISETIGSSANERSLWYVNNRKKIFNSQVTFTIFVAAFALLLLPNIFDGIKKLSLTEWLQIAIFPAVGICYYGFSKKLSLRQTHWLKPFIIGFVWSGIVTVYPVIYAQLQSNQQLHFTLINLFLFVKNLMFIAVLCIMFDFKDYATDYNQHLKTFVVSFGLRKTIFYIIIPLIILGFTSFLIVTHYRHFSVIKIAINAIPFILLTGVAFSLTKRKSIFYYLIVIDGLMLVKAMCGIFANNF